MMPRRPYTAPLQMRELPNPERAKPCVLVVDDDEAVVAGVAARLGGDFRVVGTQNPHEAVSVALRERADIILCDINMPGLKGDEVAFALSEHDGTRQTPLIYLTTLIEATEGEELDGLFGDHPVISKSAPGAELRSLVFETLGLLADE